MENPNKLGGYFHAINVGSVGKPKDGNPKCCYAVITFDKSSDFSKKERIEVEFIRVAYDIEKAVKPLKIVNYRIVYALMLRKAY